MPTQHRERSISAGPVWINKRWKPSCMSGHTVGLLYMFAAAKQVVQLAVNNSNYYFLSWNKLLSKSIFTLARPSLKAGPADITVLHNRNIVIATWDLGKVGMPETTFIRWIRPQTRSGKKPHLFWYATWCIDWPCVYMVTYSHKMQILKDFISAFGLHDKTEIC